MNYKVDKSKDKVDKIKDVDNEVVKKQIEAWKSRFTDNNERGRDMIGFITQGDQWESVQTSERWLANKESLTFNICWKEMKRMKSQIKEIEFSVDVFPTTKQSEENVEETNAFRILMDNIVLERSVISKVSETFEKCVDYGYSFGQVDFRRISNDDLSLYPVYIAHKDPSMGFWDLNAYTPTKIDGRYAGISRVLTGKELKRKYTDKELKKCMGHEGTRTRRKALGFFLKD